MTFKKLLLTSLLSAALAAPAMADTVSTDELATPVIALMPAFKAIRDDLNLDETQAKTIDAWIAEAPAKRKELSQQAMEIRAQLRDALINRDSRLKREELKQKLADKNRELIELSSLCARMLHSTLNKDQYAKVVTRYKQGNKS